MEIEFFLKGLLIGFAIAAPVGPIGILCIRRTLEYGRLSGFFSGLGAAAADSFYAVIAAFGLTLVSNFLIEEQFWFRLIGGVFLLFLGWKTVNSKLEVQEKRVSHSSLFNDFISTFFLTITNPLTILSFLAIFAGFGLSSSEGDYLHAGMLVAGVFIGSALWWLTLSEGITVFRKKFSKVALLWISRVAGLMIFCFGVAALLSLFF